jgi:bacterioferritin-associated ferredoxin
MCAHAARGGYWAHTPQGLAVAMVAAGGVTLLCYGNSVRGELVWDDVPAIVENRDVRGGPGNPLAALLWRDFWGFDLQSTISHKVARPRTLSAVSTSPCWKDIRATGAVGTCCGRGVCSLLAMLTNRGACTESNMRGSDIRGLMAGPQSWRPLTTLTFRLQYQLHELWPLPYHLLNLAQHALTTVLVVLLADHLASLWVLPLPHHRDSHAAYLL